MDYVKVKLKVVEGELSWRDYGVEIHPEASVSDLIAGLAKKTGVSGKGVRFLLEFDPKKTVIEQLSLVKSANLNFVLLVDKPAPCR